MPESTKQQNLTYSPRIKEVDGERYIWDNLRQKWLVLTPEEQVRQATIAMLVSLGVPSLRISQEYPVNVNGQNQRADIVGIDQQAKPYILVECKAAEVVINDDVSRQAMRYNMVVGARFLILTNGRKLFAFEYANGQYRALRSLQEML